VIVVLDVTAPAGMFMTTLPLAKESVPPEVPMTWLSVDPELPPPLPQAVMVHRIASRQRIRKVKLSLFMRSPPSE
jgi:predicted anti-sigma-YlaC factor YlaD